MLNLKILVLFSLLFCASSCYTLEQAFRFNNTFNGRVPVAKALHDEKLDEVLKGKLLLSRDIVGFAASQGLNVGDAYDFAILQTEGAVSYSVQAAHSDRLELITWWFPIVGSVPYLGYFDIKERDDKAAELRQQGYDVSLATVGAFSSLGWFSDPLYLSMTKRSDADFAQLLLHELVHRSFWSKGSAAFNENLAEFVGNRLAEIYLKSRDRHKDWQELEREEANQLIFRRWLVAMKEELDKVYKLADIDKTEKLKRKSEIIRLFQNERFPAELKDPGYQAARKREWNNANIMASTLYLPDTALFEKAYRCVLPATMGGFLEALRLAEKATGDADQALSSLCKTAA